MALVSNLIILALAASTQAAAEKAAEKTWTVDPASKVTFLAVGKPSFLKIRGEGAKPAGSVTEKKDQASGEISLNLNDFTTGIAMRDTHMKEKYLETGKPGNEKAVVKLEGIPVSCLKDGQKCEVKGTLTLHGKTNPIKDASFTSSKAGDGLSVHTEFPLDLNAYEVAVPSYSGITVAGAVTVTADLILK